MSSGPPVNSSRTDSVRAVSAFIGRILGGFKYHPYIFMLDKGVFSEDPVYPFAHQVELLVKLFVRRPIRVLIGDEIGLGKTVVAIMILRYLMETGEVKRALILLPRVLMQQWLGELGRFGVTNIYQLDRDTFRRYVNMKFPEGVYVTSIDWAKREKYRDAILSVEWGLVIVDEAHRVGKAGPYETLRREFVRQLVSKPDINLVLLTATPHRGKAEDYLERIKLLDPHLPDDVTLLDTRDFYILILNTLVFRRTKREVNEVYEGRGVFKDCKFKARIVSASSIEIEFHNRLIEFLKRKLQEYTSRERRESRVIPLLLTLIAKRASSSPRAAMLTLDRIIARRVRGPRSAKEIEELEKQAEKLVDSYFGYSFEDSGLYADESDESGAEPDFILTSFAERCSVFLSNTDISELREIHKLAGKIAGDGDSRLKALINIINEHLKIGDRVVVFTEYADTADYVYRELSMRLGGDKVALVTSKEIMLPGFTPTSGRRPTIEDVKSWLRSGRVSVIVSTDFASEGLNLQYANIVVHYEPTWSPVKIVQRIGRVWRVGQTKDVYSYSILLGVESDLSVLQILYAKLLAWLISGMTKDVPIGEELEIDMLARDGPSTISVPLSQEKGRPEYSEYKAILEFLAGGKKGLEKYIMDILEALRKLKEEADNALRTEHDINVRKILVGNFLGDVLGGLYGAEAEGALRELFISLAKLHGYNVEVRDGKVYAGGKYVGLQEAKDFYGALSSLASATPEGSGALSALLVEESSLEKGKVLYLYEVRVSVENRPCYSEVVGVLVRDDSSYEYVRGVKLLKLLARSLEKLVDVADHVYSPGYNFIESLKSKFLKYYPERVISKFTRYMEEVERDFGGKHEEWKPKSLGGVKVSIEPIAAIFTLATGERGEGAPPPALVEHVEAEAMNLAMNFEKEQGRIPEDVSMREHYDIRSYDPKTGETRHIEVKGLSGFDLSLVELTTAEFKVAERLADKYWLYVVLGISTSNPTLLAIRDPVHRLKWQPQVIAFRLTSWEDTTAKAT